MPQSKVVMSLEGLGDLLFGFKRDIRITNAHADQDHQTIHLTVEGNDVPDAPLTKLEYSVVYGRKVDFKKDRRRVKNPVREVFLAEIKPA